MNKKHINEDAIANELRGGSLFFNNRVESTANSPTQKPRAEDAVVPLASPAPARPDSTSSPSLPESATSRLKAKSKKIDLNDSSLASNNASMLANYPEKMIDDIRRTIKSPGKDVSFVRMTHEEKKQLVDIVYTYKSQGVKTSETEINRIAVNFMLEDYKANGEESVLAKVIAALLA